MCGCVRARELVREYGFVNVDLLLFPQVLV